MENTDSFTPQEYAKMVGMFPDAPNNPLPTGGYMDEGFDWVVNQAESEPSTMIEVGIGSPSGSTKEWTRLFTVNTPYSDEELAEYVMPSMKLDLKHHQKEYYWREEGDRPSTIVNVTMGSPSGQTTGGWQIDEDLMAYGDEEDIESFTLNLMFMIKNSLAVRYENDDLTGFMFSINHDEINRQADLAESKFRPKFSAEMTKDEKDIDAFADRVEILEDLEDVADFGSEMNVDEDKSKEVIENAMKEYDEYVADKEAYDDDDIISFEEWFDWHLGDDELEGDEETLEYLKTLPSYNSPESNDWIWKIYHGAETFGSEWVVEAVQQNLNDKDFVNHAYTVLIGGDAKTFEEKSMAIAETMNQNANNDDFTSWIEGELFNTETFGAESKKKSKSMFTKDKRGRMYARNRKGQIITHNSEYEGMIALLEQVDDDTLIEVGNYFGLSNDDMDDLYDEIVVAIKKSPSSYLDQLDMILNDEYEADNQSAVYQPSSEPTGVSPATEPTNENPNLFGSDMLKPIKKNKDWLSLVLGTTAVVLGGGLFAQSKGWLNFGADGDEAKEEGDLPPAPAEEPSLVASPSTGDLLPADYEEMIVESTGYAVPVIPVGLDGSFMGSRFHALPTDRLIESNEPRCWFAHRCSHVSRYKLP